MYNFSVAFRREVSAKPRRGAEQPSGLMTGFQLTRPLIQRDRGAPGVSSRNVDGGTFTGTLLGHDFSRVAVWPEDVYEQEAERIAKDVMRIPEPHSQSFLGTEGVPSSGVGKTAAPAAVHKAVQSPGRPLDRSIRTLMESRLGYDFSAVRVHVGSEARESAHALNALAYTNGRHIVLAQGEHPPTTTEGKQIMAHELVHVMQQGGRSDVVQRYPAGPGVVPPYLQNRVDKALVHMQGSSLDYEVNLANEILNGGIDIAYPDFVDTDKSPPEPMPVDSALNRKQRWETGLEPSLNIKAYVPGSNRELPIRKGQEAFTAQHADYDGVIYLFSMAMPSKLASVLLHDALHLMHPLGIKPGEPNADREKFVAEIRSYYYADYRNVRDEEVRFERAVRDAESDTAYLAGLGISIEQVVLNRQMWLAEAGGP